VQSTPSASVVIPTRGRPAYLDVTLGSVVPQARAASAEVVVVSDGPDAQTAAVAARHGARLITLPASRGANAARNAAAGRTTSELLVFIDDDISAPDGWLDALLAGAAVAPDHDVFGGPIEARLEGGGPRACGREPAPITTLDRGPHDRDVPFVWSADMAVRRRALERTGPFDESIFVRGDEEDWQRRHAAAGGRTRYLAAAGLVHRRTPADSTLSRLARAAYVQGRAARRYDVRKGTSPRLHRELRTLAGCAWHTVRRRCAYGIVFGAHSAGRIREWLRPQAPPADSRDDFASGTSGQVWGIRATAKALIADALDDAVAVITLQRPRLRRAAARLPRRRVLTFAIERTDVPNLLGEARGELARSRHDVRLVSAPVGTRGKFENLNALLETHPPGDADWLLVIDDDVALPSGFLDTFLFLAERFDLHIAQPAHRHRSHAALQVTRRRRGSVARETAYVEIGPATAFHRTTFDALLPFPPLRFGWGLDLHWSAIAQSHGWREGIIDATPIRHGLRQIATSYSRGDAVAEAREFLAARPYTPAREAQRTLVRHRSWAE
jgi:GT2 family glycosyltransferase